MFASSEFEVVLPAENREGSIVGYASHRKQDKRIVLITRWFRSSRSTWWSARFPPSSYSLRTSQVSKHMSVFISQVALAELFYFLPFLNSIPALIWLHCAALLVSRSDSSTEAKAPSHSNQMYVYSSARNIIPCLQNREWSLSHLGNPGLRLTYAWAKEGNRSWQELHNSMHNCSNQNKVWTHWPITPLFLARTCINICYCYF